MKRIILSLALLFITGASFAQTLTIYNGVAINSLKGQVLELFPEKVVSYSGLVGIEYLEKKWWYLSTELGYMQLGGKEPVYFSMPVRPQEKQTFNYVHLNTSLRLRARYSKAEFYIGGGPYVNALMGDNNFDQALYSEYNVKRMNWGIKTEAGITERVGKVKVGVNCTYLFPLSAVAKSMYTRMDARSLAFYLSLGVPVR